MEVSELFRLGGKRARDCLVPLSDEFLIQDPTSLKKVCAGRELGDANKPPVFDAIAEVDDFYDPGELDEAQEMLVFDVMKSLEEELGVSTSFYPVSSENVLDNTASLLDSENIFLSENSDCLNDIIDDDVRYHGHDISRTGGTPMPSAAATKHSESEDLLEGSSQILNTVSPQFVDTLHEECLSCSTEASSQRAKAGLDMGYLLEASDDELGISPSPRSEISKSEVRLVSFSFPETDTESTSDSLDLTSCQDESNWLTGDHFDLDFESDLTTQEWIKNALSSLRSGWDPSVLGSAISDAAAAACLEPACATH